MTGPGALDPTIARTAATAHAAATGRAQSPTRSPFSSAGRGSLRAKPRLSALPDLVRAHRSGGKASARRRRKGPDSAEPAAAPHEAQEREIALKEQHDAQGGAARPHELPAPGLAREAGLFSWFERLPGTPSRVVARPPARRKPDTADGLDRGFDSRSGQRSAPQAAVRNAIPDAWETGIYRHLVKAGVVSIGAGSRATLFHHVATVPGSGPATSTLLRPRQGQPDASAPVGSRLRSLLGGVGRWQAGLRGLLRSVAWLLNGARAVLGCWFEAGRFRAAGPSSASHAGVRAWVFP